MSRFGSCSRCQRHYRSAATRDMAERRAAIVAELSGGEPARHLTPLITYSSSNVIPKRKTKSDASETFRLTGTVQSG